MSSKNKIIIEIDDREPDCQMLADVEGLNLEFKKKRLVIGDFVYKDLVVERKTVDDFCNSILDGRLERQINNMLKSDKQKIIIVIGKIEKRAVSMHEHCILGKMISIIFKYKIPLIQVRTEKEFLWCLKNLCEKVNKKNKNDKIKTR